MRIDLVKEIVADLRMGDGMITEPEGQLKRVLAASTEAYIAYFDDKPAAVWGLHSESFFDRSVGVWMVTTPVIEYHTKAFVRGAVILKRQLLERFELLYGLVDAYQHQAIRWLEWHGFTVLPPMKMDKLLVRRFEMRRG